MHRGGLEGDLEGRGTSKAGRGVGWEAGAGESGKMFTVPLLNQHTLKNSNSWGMKMIPSIIVD